jgi:MFS family permease
MRLGSRPAFAQGNAFVVFLTARFLSLIADQIALLAIPIAVYVITNEVSWSGIALAVQWLPRIVFLPILGDMVDRFDLRRQYAAIDLIRALLAVSLLMVDGLILMMMVAGLLSLLNGYAFVILEYTVANRFDPRTLARNQSLLQAVENLSRVAGPALAGLTLGMADLGWTMLLCSLLFVSGFGLTVFAFPSGESSGSKRIKPPANTGRLRYAFGLLWRVKPLRRLVGLTLGINFMDGALMAVLPAIIITRLDQSETTIGYLNSLAAVAVILAMFAASRFVDQSRVQVMGYAAMVVSIIAMTLMAVAPTLAVFSSGFVAYFVAKSVFVLFLRTERVRHIPTENMGIVLGALIAVILSSIPLSGLLVAWAGSYLSLSTLLLGAIAVAGFSQIYFILSTRNA